MKINKVYSKLRKKNMKNYFLLLFSIIFSMAVITAYSVIYYSPTISNVLIAGGDSMQLTTMIFILAILGCVVFISYASTLFLKYKSKEIGVLLALGSDKKNIKKVLFIELVLIILGGSLIGALLGLPIAYISWNALCSLIVKTQETNFVFGWSGYIFSFMFFILIVLCIFIRATSFIKRSNIMDIVNTHRVSEKIKDVGKLYGVIGIILIPLGMILGYILSSVRTSTSFIVSNIHLRRASNLIYIFSFIGIYMVMVYITVRGRKGKNLRKYYKGIISKSMIRFHGRQNVKTMCIAAILAAAAMFSILGNVTAYFQGVNYIKNFPNDYLFNSKMSEVQVTNDEIYKLACKYDVNITRFNEFFAMELMRDGNFEEYLDDGGIKKTYHKELKTSLFMKESDYNKITKQNIHIKSGKYCDIKTSYLGAPEDDAEKLIITNPITKEASALCHQQTLHYDGLYFDMYRESLFVISDEDFDKEYKILKDENKLRYVVFDVEDCSKSYYFGKELRRRIINNSSSRVAVNKSHRREKITLNAESGKVYRWWAYNPKFRPLEHNSAAKAYAVYLLLFIFIAFICFAAMGTILYVRSMTMALHDKIVYNDLEKLGADKKYIKRCITKQLRGIYMIPMIIGSLGPSAFYMLIAVLGESFRTDIMIKSSISVTMLICLYQYILFILTRNKVVRLIEE
ncbi:FtsX-like permease family protein [Clostridium lundense]|uniref:FtsX-like permease family protein n=1 Tax=Clostridium lundense TaxID=319475 RepID=UPI0004801B16|nr:ABC transporter permease [Clostridium lundense]